MKIPNNNSIDFVEGWWIEKIGYFYIDVLRVCIIRNGKVIKSLKMCA